MTCNLECNSINIIPKFKCPNWEPDEGGEWLPVACTDFLKGSGEKKGTLASVLAPKRAL